MKKKFIAICTPTLGMVSMEWAYKLRSLVWPMNTGFIQLSVQDDVGGEVAECRNRCVQLALGVNSDTREVTHLFWLDDDVLIKPLALLALLSHNRPIASGVYFTRCEYSQPLIFPARFGGVAPFVPDTAAEMWGHGMGLTLVEMGVYKHMIEDGKLGKDKYGRHQFYKTTGGEDLEVIDGMACMEGTEDLFFLEAASKLAYKPVVDMGRQAFGWHYDKEKKTAYPLKQWEQARAGKPIVWDTPNGEVIWK